MTIKRIIFLCGIACSATWVSACAAKPKTINVSVDMGANAVPVQSSDSTATANDLNASLRAKMPKSLLGVWHEDTQHGRDQCERYRRLDIDQQPADEASDPLVGALVITDRIVHAYSEYGEGNFFSIQNVQQLSAGQWRVQSRVYIDTMPFEGEPGTESVDLFLLHGGKLRWTEEGRGGRTQSESPFFLRCGPVRKAF